MATRLGLKVRLHSPILDGCLCADGHLDNQTPQPCSAHLPPEGFPRLQHVPFFLCTLGRAPTPKTLPRPGASLKLDPKPAALDTGSSCCCGPDGGSHRQCQDTGTRPLGPQPPTLPGSLLPSYTVAMSVHRGTSSLQSPSALTSSFFLRDFWGITCCLVNKSRATGIIYLSNSSQLPLSAVSPAQPCHPELTDTLPQAILADERGAHNQRTLHQLMHAAGQN